MTTTISVRRVMYTHIYILQDFVRLSKIYKLPVSAGPLQLFRHSATFLDSKTCTDTLRVQIHTLVEWSLGYLFLVPREIYTRPV